MLPIKLLIWIFMVPAAIIAYLVVTLFDTIVFLFNCPVDIWTLITESFSSAQEE